MMGRAVMGAIGCGCCEACWRADPVSGTNHDPEVTAPMSTPLETEPGAASVAPEAVLEGEKRIEGRSLGQIAWARLKRDKVARAGVYCEVSLVLDAFLPRIIV